MEKEVKMVEIPKQFKLFNNIIKVKISNELKKANKYGETHYNLDEIRLAEDLFEEKSEMTGITFLHELVHTILGKMSEYELSDNEKFVQTFAELLNQAISTMEYGEQDECK